MTPSFGTARISASPGTASTTSDVQTPIEPRLDWTPSPAVDAALPQPGTQHATVPDIGLPDTASGDAVLPLDRPHDRERKASPRVRRLKSFLESLDLTMYHISQVTARQPFGKGTRAHIRDAFYAELDSGQPPDSHQ